MLIFSWMLIFTGCSSYYQINQEFNRYFETGALKDAEKALADTKKAETGRNRLLYFLNRGVVSSMLGDYNQSNKFFEQAYLYGEDRTRHHLEEAASFFTNPSVVPYKGEDHEHLMLLYYKAINYLKIGDYDAALVECRRMNNRLNQLSDKYRSDKKYKRDAFIHTLMGLIYDANRDYNNAFIAYRNAYNIYKEDYIRLFKLKAPDQLKRDILRTAYLMGFQTDLSFYEREFDMKYQSSSHTGGEVVLMWQNGLGPVKSEWSINMVLQHNNGQIVFVNEEFGFNFPFPYTYQDADNNPDPIRDLKIMRVAFPKYIERPLMYTSAEVLYQGEKFELERVEDVNSIAFKVLEERKLAEFSKALLRVAVKKATEMSLRKENNGLGAVLGAVNAITEKTDTRNWQTLPHSIYYVRVPVEEGLNEMELKLYTPKDKKASKTEQFAFDVRKNSVYFHSFQSLDVSPHFMSRGY